MIDLRENSLCRLGFIYQAEIVGPDGKVLVSGPPVCNIIPQQGIDHIAGLIKGTTVPISAWYIGVGEADYVPTSGTSAADLPTLVAESVAYSETTRPLWDNEYDGVGTLSNAGLRAEYTFTADKRLRTGFIVSDATRGSASGVLLSIVRFDSPYDVPAGSTFRLGASIALLSV